MMLTVRRIHDCGCCNHLRCMIQNLNRSIWILHESSQDTHWLRKCLYKRLVAIVLCPSIILPMWPIMVGYPTKTNVWLILEIVLHQQSRAIELHFKSEPLTQLWTVLELPNFAPFRRFGYRVIYNGRCFWGPTHFGIFGMPNEFDLQ